MENVSKALDGPDRLSLINQFLRAKIDRVGDLLSDLYFSFRLPDIYSKYLTPTASRSSQYQFQWSRYIGAAIIQNVYFSVGGQKIQEFDGTYLLARAMADYTQDEFEKWRILVGDTEELTDPSKGLVFRWFECYWISFCLLQQVNHNSDESPKHVSVRTFMLT
jgi:hypothetical protein